MLSGKGANIAMNEEAHPRTDLDPESERGTRECQKRFNGVADLAAATADSAGQLDSPRPGRPRRDFHRPSFDGLGGGPHHGRRHRPRLSDQGSRLHCSRRRSRSRSLAVGRRRQEETQRRGILLHLQVLVAAPGN